MAAVARVQNLPGATWHSGYMRSFRDDPLGLLVACTRQGDAVSLRFGLSRVMLVSHPGLIEEVLVAHAQDFRKSQGTRRLRSLLGDGLLTSDGETWRRQRRLVQPAFHRDLLSMLLAAGDREIRDAVITFLLAGHETTALTLAWACYLLDQNPAAAERLRTELNCELKGQAPGLADLPRLPYLDAVVAETLRLYPPAYLIGREALRDLAIGNYPIRRGTTVLISQYVVQRDPRWFDQPDSFLPERWLDGRLARELPRFAYFPFGGGQRQCIGNTFAQVEANLLLAILAQRVQLRLVPGHPVEPQAVVTLQPRHGIRMTITRVDGAAGVPSRPGPPA